MFEVNSVPLSLTIMRGHPMSIDDAVALAHDLGAVSKVSVTRLRHSKPAGQASHVMRELPIGPAFHLRLERRPDKEQVDWSLACPCVQQAIEVNPRKGQTVLVIGREDDD
jgi:hypothetical protein